jgi:hypothetical protein
MFRAAMLPATMFVVLACAACSGPPQRGDAGGAAGESAPEPRVPGAEGIFVDRAAETGLDFFQFNGMAGAYHMAEITGSGGALFDYDGDGDLDAYLVQGTMLEAGQDVAEAVVAPRHPPPLGDRLYRNELRPGEPGSLAFTDVTEESRIRAMGYGMGVAVGDYDRDGRPDLYLTNHGPNQLLRNEGDGTFSDRTLEAGVGEERWSVPATFFDFDRDGWLDLFVGNYLVYETPNPVVCRDTTGALDYCGPGNFPSERDRLFRNLGDGTFEDVTEAAGLAAGFGPALGVVAADLTGDGWLDLYVTNDARPNNFWVNQRDGTFRDDALLAGCSVNAEGKAEASMGVDAGDFDGDGDLDLFMTHLVSETNTLYRNDGTGNFDDHTQMAGLGSPSRLHTAFGTSWFDFDNDGWLDLFIANGAVKKIESLASAGDPFPLHEPNQLFRSLAGERFTDVTAEAGPAFAHSEVSRGAAFGDVDNDGDPDILLVNNNGPARLLINRVGNLRPWIGFRLVTPEGLDAPGARAELLRADGPPLHRRVRLEGSFCSANDPRLLFGLGEGAAVERLRVVWPDGGAEEFSELEVGRYTTLRRGAGRASQ